MFVLCNFACNAYSRFLHILFLCSDITSALRRNVYKKGTKSLKDHFVIQYFGDPNFDGLKFKDVQPWTPENLQKLKEAGLSSSKLKAKGRDLRNMNFPHTSSRKYRYISFFPNFHLYNFQKKRTSKRAFSRQWRSMPNPRKRGNTYTSLK